MIVEPPTLALNYPHMDIFMLYVILHCSVLLKLLKVTVLLVTGKPNNEFIGT